MSGLNREELEILRYYADHGNRELYWNYLAQHKDNDGYGLLALGVVRNDNVPGAVANIYAENYAKSHGGHHLSERQWQNFGVDLMRQDFKLREQMLDGRHPELALNLPVRYVQQSHDAAFRSHGIDPNAWTPRLLLDAARRHGGENEAERLWDGMLDNSYLGIHRGAGTVRDAAYRYNDSRFDASSYLSDVTAARTLATQSLPNTDPNVIGAVNFHHVYSQKSHGWSTVSGGGMDPPVFSAVRDPAVIAELNDARAVRLQRLGMRDDFHPDDPNRNREIMRSPWTLADNEQKSGDPRVAGHHRNAVYSDIAQGVEALSVNAGGVQGDVNARMTMSLYALATQCGIASVDHLLLNCQGIEHAAGSRVILVQGKDPYDPANRVAHMSVNDAINRPVEQSLQQAQASELQNKRTMSQQMQNPDQSLLASRDAMVRAL